MKSIQLPKLSFVHLDVDVYQATYNSLEFLFQNDLLLDKSFIVLDDYYRSVDGVNKAIEEIIEGYPAWMAIRLFPAQGLLIPQTWFAA